MKQKQMFFWNSVAFSMICRQDTERLSWIWPIFFSCHHLHSGIISLKRPWYKQFWGRLCDSMCLWYIDVFGWFSNFYGILKLGTLSADSLRETSPSLEWWCEVSLEAHYSTVITRPQLPQISWLLITLTFKLEVCPFIPLLQSIVTLEKLNESGWQSEGKMVGKALSRAGAVGLWAWALCDCDGQDWTTLKELQDNSPLSLS